MIFMIYFISFDDDTLSCTMQQSKVQYHIMYVYIDIYIYICVW